MSNFIDYVKIYSKSGDGGAGSRYLRRDKLTAKGGPDGGDGGRGGHVIVRGNSQLWTLLHLKYKKHIFAEKGGNGARSRSFGANGKDEIIEVPLGTIIKDSETGEAKGEILEDKQEIVILTGGIGGQGNWHFRTAVRQTPKFAQPGMPGQESTLIFELKVLADVGLVGFPNAGKSTLLSKVTAAKPKIDNYPFTTLVPNLGIVKGRDYHTFVMADIPGIIEGASEGKGLGHRFLRHIEHNALLLYLIPSDTKDHIKEFDILQNELEKFNPELTKKKFVISLSKIDMISDAEQKKIEVKFNKKYPDYDFIPFSSFREDELLKLKDVLWSKIQQNK